jgi:hypothetical protein
MPGAATALIDRPASNHARAKPPQDFKSKRRLGYAIRPFGSTFLLIFLRMRFQRRTIRVAA